MWTNNKSWAMHSLQRVGGILAAHGSAANSTLEGRWNPHRRQSSVPGGTLIIYG
jgi:hypothetical protein